MHRDMEKIPKNGCVIAHQSQDVFGYANKSKGWIVVKPCKGFDQIGHQDSACLIRDPVVFIDDDDRNLILANSAKLEKNVIRFTFFSSLADLARMRFRSSSSMNTTGSRMRHAES